MGKRLDSQRQALLEPQRITHAIKQIQSMGVYVYFRDHTKLIFDFKGFPVTYYPYSGWASGKSIKDGRGLYVLLQQLKAADLARRPVVCNCPPGLMSNPTMRYAQQVAIELPEWSSDRKSRLLHGLSTAISVDPCLVDAIKRIWEAGIDTQGCCCGHKAFRPSVLVHRKYNLRMSALGYERQLKFFSSEEELLFFYL